MAATIIINRVRVYYIKKISSYSEVILGEFGDLIPA